MTDTPLLNASCRVAIAALLHDLGKFAERARIAEANEPVDSLGNTRADIEKQNNCPSFNGRATHIHAAYTAISIDLLEAHLPALVGEEQTPFAPWGRKGVDDSIINAAARHHRPGTFLQWIVATADRLASGFEREEFEAYNQSPDDGEAKLNHYTTRQWTLLEGIGEPKVGAKSPAMPNYRYPLEPLSPASIFPVASDVCEVGNNASAQASYLTLWKQFLDGLNLIPRSHRANLPLWLDHFDSLWLTYTHAIPSATAGIGGNVRPDVSLYDHSKTTAALAVALWRYHADQGHDLDEVREELRAQWDQKRIGTPETVDAWNTEKFLLIQGDFFGIQDFVFGDAGQTQQHAARLLRGRSFYVSLLCELAAVKVLEALCLPAVSQVVNAAGKFLILAPNTPATREKLGQTQRELNEWFLAHTFGQCGISVVSLAARPADFKNRDLKRSPFSELTQRLFQSLETAKLARFDLCGEGARAALFDGTLERYTHGECRIDGRSPAEVELDEGLWVSTLSADQIDAGKWLAQQDRLLVTTSRLEALDGAEPPNQLRLAIFGFHVVFTGDEEASGKFGQLADSGNLRRAWDFSLPTSSTGALWSGYARRHINAYVPRLGEVNERDAERYAGIDHQETFDAHPNQPKTLNHLARDSRTLTPAGRWIGVEALSILKGDVDDLGLVFQQGMQRPTFARMAALSRQVNAFFTVYLPSLCASDFPGTYTVFAGGDDFFLIGPWLSTIRLAKRMKDEFKRYVANNSAIHFSVGLAIAKPGLPIRQLAAMAEEALGAAKAVTGKNAVTCFGHAVSWNDFDTLMEREAALARLAEEQSLSTGYLYALLQYTDMAAELKASNPRPQAALWRSHFAYRTRRLAESRYTDVQDKSEREKKRQRLHAELGAEIAGHGIEKHGAAYKIALFTYLYQQRD